MIENTKIVKSAMPVSITTDQMQKMIYCLRNQQVLLDFDLADIYGYEVKRLNEQVKRNIVRFPEDFMFQLTADEVEMVKSQNATSRNETFFAGQMGGRRKLPYAFTEQGIYMLGTVLKGSVAEKQTINVMRAFREMRHFITNNKFMFEKIYNVELRQLEYQKQSETKFNQIFEYISDHKESNQKNFYSGQIFDTFNFITELICQAAEEIVLMMDMLMLLHLIFCRRKKKVLI